MSAFPETECYILYFIQNSLRSSWNNAFTFSLSEAEETGLPLVALYVPDISDPYLNERNISFLYERLEEPGQDLKELNQQKPSSRA